MRTGTRGFLPTLVGFVMVGSLLPLAAPGVALAAPTELFFSEYIEGTSNNKALEIFNGTGAPVDLAAGGYNVQMFFNGSATAGLTINLAGTVADGDVFVLAQSSANATILAQADQTNGSGWFNGDDAVVLRMGTTVIDVIGQIGLDPGTEWGSGLTSTADNTLRRKTSIEAGDTNGFDAFDPSIEWDGFATDTFNGLGAHPGDASAPHVASTSPASNATGVAASSNVTVTFSEPVTVTGTWFTISCATSGAHTAAASTGPLMFTLNPDVDFAEGESCTVTILAAQVSDQDTDDPPDQMAANYVWSFTVEDTNPCDDPYTPIYDIQGSGTSAAITGTVSTLGVVVGDFEGSTSVGLQGFYLQDAEGDGDPATSDGIFVFAGNTDNGFAVGDVVRVTGNAGEFNSQTQVGMTSFAECGTADVPPYVDLELPMDGPNGFERFEGMRVRFPHELVISEYFQYEQFGELVLARPLAGEERAFTPTNLEEPGSPEYAARLLANQRSRVTLNDGLGISNPPSVRHPNGQPFSETNGFRGGDIVENAIGVLGERTTATTPLPVYRIEPTGPADYTALNHRPEEPDDVGGRLKVAAFNTLNFFITLDYPTGNPLDNKCGPLQNVECRGADADQPDEFTRQRTKLLEALMGIDADVVGLNEMENTTGVDPLGDPDGLVTGLNDELGAGTYAHIDTGTIGTDAIKVGIIYRPASVTPVGSYQILDSSVDPRFIDTLSRPALAQTFMENATGERFTVVVNHLKSKGSACPGDPDTGDGQGNCNLTRKAAAEAMVDWLATDPTGSNDPDFLIMGDLNSYAREDPIDAIRAGPDDTPGTADDYTNLIEQELGPFAYSFVFDGMAGYLDHALSNATLTGQVTGATEWHINADEPDILDYDTTFKPPAQEDLFEPNAYRSSDHDPVIVGLDLSSAATATRVTGNGTFADGSFAISIQYNKKKNVQTLFGNTSLALTGGLNFASTGYDWLVAFDNEAYFRASGTLNGTAGYRLYAAVSDGGSPGAGNDEIRLQIVEIASGNIVYDSQPGELVTAPPTSPLTSGNLSVKQPK